MLLVKIFRNFGKTKILTTIQSCMSFFEQYKKFQVVITYYKNSQAIARDKPEVGNMRTAYSIAMKRKKKLGADDYSVLKIG